MIITSTPALPPLLELQGDDEMDLKLTVFYHRTIIQPSQGLEPGFGNADRLTELGSQAWRFAATQFYFSFQPVLQSSELVMKIKEMTEGTRIHEILNAYDLKPKLRVPQNTEAQEIWTDNAEMERYFYTYVGALCCCHGSTVVFNWASALFNMAEGIKPEDDEDATMAPPPNYAAPPAPASPPPPHYPSASGPARDASASAAGSNSYINLLTLSLIHETAAKNKANIEYTQTPTGPPHNPVWTVRCLVNGQEKGSATAAKTKTAKEDAARAAFFAMGWNPRN